MKIHCIIPTRYESARLPGKVAEDIGGKCLLLRVFERCSQAKKIDRVIIAWHETDKDRMNHMRRTVPTPVWVNGGFDPAARCAYVLSQLLCDGFVRVCHDSPFIDPEVIDEAAQKIIEGHDYWLASGGVHGNQAEGFNAGIFMCAEPFMTGEEREHLGLWFQRRDRLTVDTPADLERARLIVSRMTKPHTEYTAAECLALLRQG